MSRNFYPENVTPENIDMFVSTFEECFRSSLQQDPGDRYIEALGRSALFVFGDPPEDHDLFEAIKNITVILQQLGVVMPVDLNKF